MAGSSGVSYAFLKGRKQRLRQYQCCLCAITLALIITFLTVIVSLVERDDFGEAIDAGTTELENRDNLEKNGSVLQLSSPSYRHQKAMATNSLANSLARVGFGAHMASKHMAKARSR